MDTRDTDPTQPQGPPEGEEPTPSPKRLTRSTSERVIGGVCGGIAQYLGIDVVIVRIAAVVLAVLSGGVGVAVYLASLLLIPKDDATPRGGNRTLTVIGAIALLLIAAPLLVGGGVVAAVLVIPLAILTLAGLGTWWLATGEGPGGGAGEVVRRAALGVGVLFLCALIAAGGAAAAGLGGGTVAAAVVIGAGVALIAGAFVGRVRWLIPPALSLALAVGFVSAAGIDFHGGVGQRVYKPASASQLRHDYRLGIGDLVVDLRDARLPAGDTPVKLHVGMGAARLIVPENVCVASRATVGIGAVDLFRHGSGGIDFDWDDRPVAPARRTRVVVDADIGVGALVVSHTRSDPANRDFGHFHDGGGNEVGNAGCRETRAAR